MTPRVGVVALAALLLVGCGAAEANTDEPTADTPAATAASEATKPSPTPTPTPTPTPSPSPTYAPPQQIASIIAEHEADWRETIEAAEDCRVMWMEKSDDPIVEVKVMSCHLREATLSLQSKTVLEELDALTPEPSMSRLVTETKLALASIKAAAVDEKCGPSGESADTAGCLLAHGNAHLGYDALEDALNAWGPYL